MALNPYDNCPCGSGKKFKWCCVAYFDKIEQAVDMLQQSQFENAVRVMEGLTKQYPDRPQVWGYYAHILFREGHIDKAETVLEKAFELDPQFPMGFFLRGLFRQSEGEVIGALLMYRKAVEVYPPEARDQLSQVYEMIARNELILNRPVASRAALEQALNYSPPGDQEIRDQYEAMYGPESRLPEVVKKKYAFRRTAKPIIAPIGSKLSDARRVFEQLVTQTPGDPAAWFNLGLVRAWQGDQAAAVEALRYSVESEWNDELAEETGALAESLKCGHGMEGESDYSETRIYLQIREPNAVMELLQAWDQEARMIAAQSDESGQSFTCMVVEPLPSLVDTGTVMAKVLANVTIAGGTISLRHTSRETVTKIAVEIRERLNMAVGEPVPGAGTAQFGELLQEALAYPVRTADVNDAESKLRAYAENFFENVWIHRPLRSLSGVTALDAAGSKLLRKCLLGVLRFLEDILNSSAPRKQQGQASVVVSVYDFNRMRHKIGVERQPPGEPPASLIAEVDAAVAAEAADVEKAAETARAIDAARIQAAKEAEMAKAAEAARQQAAVRAAEEAAIAAAAPKPKDFGSMNAADLAGLNRDELGAVELEDAMRAALKLDARELAVAFARSGVGKPADAAKPDRYPLFAVAIQGAIAEGNTDAALQLAHEGTAFDATSNDGKRANDFTIQRARLLCRKGDTEAASKEFEDLIARSPDEPKFYITAMELMLSAKQPSKTLKFAELGLAKARSSGNRDLEGACLELSEAAKRMG